jgi:two-component system response regulator HydG
MSDRVLFVDDDHELCESVREYLAEHGYEITTTISPAEAIDLVCRKDFDTIVTDLGMSEMDGIALCQRLLGIRSDVPILVLTGNVNLENAVAAIRARAFDFIAKPVDPKVLVGYIERAIRSRKLELEVKRLQVEAPEVAPLGVTGTSPAFKRVQELAARVGPRDISVLIRGETGTGKEIVARAIHASSERRARPFVAVNCAAVPASLMESELFGHARGAFTDAKAAREGLFVRASGGTLFLDEVGEMPLEMQPKLLRALQERTVRPVGSNEEVPFDVRILAATHRDLEAEIAAHRFREDLFYRLNVVEIAVPPLRERPGDILALANHFLRASTTRLAKGEMKISEQVAGLLLAYDWPGNVRELENCVERVVALARFDHLSAEDLPEPVRASAASSRVASVAAS